MIVSMPISTLVLFDIDGTLLSAGRASRQALHEAFHRNGVAEMVFDGYDFSGKTDPQIVRELLARRGVEGVAIERVIEHYLEALETRILPGEIVAKRGAADLLAALAE